MKKTSISFLSFVLGVLFNIVSASGSTVAQLSPPQTPSSSQERVSVGLYINDVQNLDLKTHSYTLDFYLWFRWRNPELDPASTFEFINATESWGHTKALDYEKPVLLPNGELYQVIHVQGKFSRKLPLFDYPFDKQRLGLEFEDTSESVTNFQYVLDENPITMNPSLQLPGFKVAKPTIQLVSKSYPTNFGDLREKTDQTYSRIVVDIPIERSVLAYVLKLIFPILCVIFCAALIFFLHPSRVDARVGIGITALLTIVALQMTLNEDLPEVDYLVLMDKIYLAGYLFVIACLAMVIRSARLNDQIGDQMEKVYRLDKLSLMIICPVYLLIVALIIARIL